jgi:hypothetical protein
MHPKRNKLHRNIHHVAYARSLSSTHTLTHTYAHTQTLTYAHTHTHTHSCTMAGCCWSSWLVQHYKQCAQPHIHGRARPWQLWEPAFLDMQVRFISKNCAHYQICYCKYLCRFNELAGHFPEAIIGINCYYYMFVQVLRASGTLPWSHHRYVFASLCLEDGWNGKRQVVLSTSHTRLCTPVITNLNEPVSWTK